MRTRPKPAPVPVINARIEKYVLEGSMQLTSQIGGIPFGLVHVVNVEPRIGVSSKPCQLLRQDPQGLAVFGIVRNELFLYCASPPVSHRCRQTMLCSPKASGSVQEAPRNLPRTFRLFEWMGK